MLRRSLAEINELDKILETDKRELALDYLVAPVDSKLEEKNRHTPNASFYRKDGLTDSDARKVFRDPKKNGHRLLTAVQPYRSLDQIVREDELGKDFPLAEIEGVETLARIFELRRQILFSAGAIFKVLDEEETGDVDMRMMEQSIMLARKLNPKERKRTVQVSANFNGYTLSSRNFAYDIIDRLETFDLPNESLAVELLESIGELSQTQIEELRKLVKRGVKIVLDDFGQSKSEALFERLTKAKIPLEAIKFDGKDLNGFGDEEQERCLGLMRQAKNAGVKKVVWEGNYLGVPMARIEALKGYLGDIPSAISQDMKHLFEGIVI